MRNQCRFSCSMPCLSGTEVASPPLLNRELGVAGGEEGHASHEQNQHFTCRGREIHSCFRGATDLCQQDRKFGCTPFSCTADVVARFVGAQNSLCFSCYPGG